MSWARQGRCRHPRSAAGRSTSGRAYSPVPCCTAPDLVRPPPGAGGRQLEVAESSVRATQLHVGESLARRVRFEGGVGHSQRVKDLLLTEAVDSPAVESLDDEGEPVVAEAVGEVLPGSNISGLFSEASVPVTGCGAPATNCQIACFLCHAG